MTVEARELYSSSMGPMVSGSRPRSERMLIEREPNAASGGELARISQEVTERFYNLSSVSVRSDTLRARACARYGVLVVGGKDW